MPAYAVGGIFQGLPEICFSDLFGKMITLYLSMVI
jgi:hypothetical protein